MEEEGTALPPPERRLVITDPETLRVLADPLRLRIIEHLVAADAKPRTVKEIARDLSTSQTKLYYHVNLLEEHGLIRVVESRVVQGIIEKRYQVTALSFDVERRLVSPGMPGMDDAVFDLLTAMFDNTRRDIEDSIRAGLAATHEDTEPRKRMLLLKNLARLDEERAVEFRDRLLELIKEYTSEEAAEGSIFGLHLAMYPMVEPTKDDDHE